MKDLSEILSHLATIDKIDGHADASAYERGRAVDVLAFNIADELIAGRPAPGTRDAARFTRIEGLVPRLADELVEHHAEAIAHRHHLAERLEADGGENGAKAAAILRGMNAVSAPANVADGMVTITLVGDAVEPGFSSIVRARFLEELRQAKVMRHFGGPPRPGEGGGGCGVPVAGSGAGGGGSCQDITDRTARYYAHEAARREHALAKAAQERIRAAEERGFDKGRNKALSIVLNERGKWSKDVVRDVLGKVSESIVYMRKEG